MNKRQSGQPLEIWNLEMIKLSSSASKVWLGGGVLEP
jgi:hypothetical protein